MDDVKKIKSFILRDLIKKKKFGAAHTPLENVIRNLPDELLNDNKGKKLINKAVKSLVNSNLILPKKKRTGKDSDVHISINPREIKKIHQYLSAKENLL